MYVSRLLKVSLFVLAFAAVLDYASLNPINEISSRSELSDLNKTPAKSKTKLGEKTESSSFTHYDEDSLRLVTDLNADQRLKYDVEVLEVSNNYNNKETPELEERFRGAAIRMDTDNFVAENIEVNGGNEKVYDEDADDKHSHILLTMVLILVALISVSLYVALVLWRSHLERRYAMRELLVTNDDDDDFYLPSSETTDRHC